MKKIGVVQWGTKHGHAKGWLELLFNSKDIEFKGVYEPDEERKKSLINSDVKLWNQISWIDNSDEFLTDKNIQIIFIEESNNKSLDVLEKCIQNTAVKHVITTEIGDCFPMVKRFLVNSVVRYVKKMVPCSKIGWAASLYLYHYGKG